jgi:hypothetical protein
MVIAKERSNPLSGGTALLKGNAEMCVLYVVSENEGQKM